MIPRIEVFDGMNLKRTMERTIPTIGLYRAMQFIYDLSKFVADILNAEIVLALPHRLQSSEINLALAFYQSTRPDFHVVWCLPPPGDEGNIEQILMAHDEYTLAHGQPAGAWYLSNDKGRDWAGRRLWTKSHQIKYTCEVHGDICNIVPQLDAMLSESRIPVRISDVTQFLEDGPRWSVGELTIFIWRKEYGFVKIQQGISLRFDLNQCDGVLKWELDGRRPAQANRPVKVYVIPDNEHPVQRVEDLHIPNHP